MADQARRRVGTAAALDRHRFAARVASWRIGRNRFVCAGTGTFPARVASRSPGALHARSRVGSTTGMRTLRTRRRRVRAFRTPTPRRTRPGRAIDGGSRQSTTRWEGDCRPTRIVPRCVAGSLVDRTGWNARTDRRIAGHTGRKCVRGNALAQLRVPNGRWV